MIQLLFSLLLNTPLSFGLELPTNMDTSEQVRLLETLGLATSTKHLSQAYPIGGYSGFEVGLSTEVIPLTSLSEFGQSSERNSRTLIYPTINVAKGFYNNSEIHLHFSPNTGASGISRYGLSLRWSFYQMASLPLNFALIGHANSSQLINQLVTRNLGLDLMTGLTLGDLSIFTLLGSGSSSGQFLGGTEGLTASQIKENHRVSSLRMTLGATYHFRPVFLSLSVDRYQINSYNLKVGLFF